METNNLEAVTGDVFLKISQNSQKNTCVRVSLFNKVAGLWHRNFPVNFSEFLGGHFL